MVELLLAGAYPMYVKFIKKYLILCLLFDAGSNFILFGIISIMLIIGFYFIYKTDLVGVQTDLINENLDEIDKFEKLNCNIF